ncbi:LysR family transcriptional regulator [Vibrio maerlii]|uniref:LysR family transcriptional regulator n=1 Tax=Vibrio maerlii TaxID=2231648 RepID=UPI000E3B7FAC|nr:LysR family transcriptional regulator [Vibrio maerlii]
MNRLRQMSIFAHVVEQGSISAAADYLDLSKSVVSQHLKTLENELGVVLLKRTTRKQVLTPTGAAFYQKCRAMNSVVDSAWSEAQDALQQPSGRVRITAPNALMETLVTPAMANILQSYPKLLPEIISSDEQLDFYEHDIDLAIRVGTSKDSNLKQRRLGAFKDVLCANATVKRAEILPYIANAWQGKHIVHLFNSENGDQKQFEAEARCVTNSFHSCLSLIQSGVGMGLVPDFYLNRVGSSLQPVFPGYHLPSNPVYALTPFNNHIPLSVEVCIQVIETQLMEVMGSAQQ